MSRSSFPDSVDSFTEFYDLPPSKASDANRFRYLKAIQNKTASEQAELNDLIISLSPYIVTPEHWNKISDAIVSIENYVKSGNFGGGSGSGQNIGNFVVENFYYKGEYDLATDYIANNFVSKDNIIYMAIADSTGKDVTNTSYWLKLSIKGDSGLSAYDLAVQIGYVGSVSDWLLSLKGAKGEDGKNVELQVEDNYIQWKNTGDANWNNLVSLTTIKGDAGISGNDGADGREVQLQVSDNHIQWKYEGDEVWNNLISLEGISTSNIITSVNGQTGDVIIAVPTKTSDLTNDSSFATETYVANEIAKASLQGDTDLSGYATVDELSTKADVNNPTFTGVPKVPTAIAGTNTTQIASTEFVKTAIDNISVFSGSYNDLADKPTIDVTKAYVDEGLTNKIDSSEKGVASGVAMLDESGNVLDGNGNIVGRSVTSVNGQTGEVVINIPSKTSELTNDSSLATETYVTNALSQGIDNVVKIKNNITISNLSWVSDDETGFYKNILNDSDISSSSIVDVNIHLSYLDKSNGIKSITQSFDGYVTLYAESLIEDDLLCDIKIVKGVI